MGIETDLFVAFDLDTFESWMTTSTDPEANVLYGEQNLVRDVLVVLLALNRSLLGTHVQRLISPLPINIHISDQV